MKRVKEFLKQTGRLLFVLSVVIIAYVFAMFQGGVVSWTIFYFILPFVAYSLLLLLYPLSSFSVERVMKTTNVQKDGKLAVTLTVKRNNRFPLLYTIISDTCNDAEFNRLAENKMKKFIVFGFRKQVSWDYEIMNMPRGEHVLEGVRIEFIDFFGWMKKKVFIPLKHVIVVYPKITKIQYVPIDTEYELGAAASPFNIIKDTTMATGVRDYQSGDRVSWIHWKSFARTQTLMTKEFEDRRSQDLVCILDGRPSGVFEEQVELTASIITKVSNEQAGIGLVTTGSEQEVFPTIRSEGQLQQAMIHLAKMKPAEATAVLQSKKFGAVLYQSGSLLIVTGSPTISFIDSVLQGAKNVRKVICFVVLKSNEGLNERQVEEIRYAKSKGVLVHALVPEQFARAFKEVTHS
jgi:uncharacterized protein (DUF58 family)